MAHLACRKIDLALGTGLLRGLDEWNGGGAPAAFHEQVPKSISATFVVVAGNAFKGCAVMSFAVVSSDGIQS